MVGCNTSTVECMMRRVTCTGLVCPMRCALPTACCKMAESKLGSSRNTWLAAPTTAAVNSIALAIDLAQHRLASEHLTKDETLEICTAADATQQLRCEGVA